MNSKYTNPFVMGIIIILTMTVTSIVTSTAAESNYTVDISSNYTLGSYLVDGSGFTLYYLLKDSSDPGNTTCCDECELDWSPFFTQNITVPSELFTGDFGYITRTDGLKQTTYRGWPLYTYNDDKKPGDVWGQGVLGGFYIVKPFIQAPMM